MSSLIFLWSLDQIYEFVDTALQPFAEADIKPKEPYIGDPEMLQCKPPASYPKPIVYWAGADPDSDMPSKLPDDRRRALDYEGN